MIRITIVTTGNEVLNGDVLDTNTNWLCKRLTGIGGYVQNAALIRDDVEAIAREIRAGLDRSATVVFTVGGMGPTADDLTLQAVATATGRDLELNPEALAYVTRKYEDLAQAGAVQDAIITPARQKMAMLPRGAMPVFNPVGAAPAVFLPIAGTSVISLPAVPAELHGIFEGSLQPTLHALFGESVFIEKVAIVDCNDESVLAPLVQVVATKYPEVYIKTRARRFGPEVKFRITLSKAGSSKETVVQEIDAALQSLREVLGAAGIAIDSIEE